MPSGGADFTFGYAFPHEANMDRLHGVDFDKGCYVGQEVVSRMEHRGTARSRIVRVLFDDGAPEAGTAVVAADKPVGTMGSSAAGHGLALLRLDRAADAIEAGIALTAGAVTIRIADPDDLKLAARFVTETPANWKSIVDNYLECYHCGPAHPGFSDSVKVDQYTHTLHGNWTVQFGHAQSSERSFKLDPSVKDPSFHGYWAWPCTMFNVPPGSNFMTVIYEFPASAEVTPGKCGTKAPFSPISFTSAPTWSAPPPPNGMATNFAGS